MNRMMGDAMNTMMNSTMMNTASFEAGEGALVSENCKVSNFSLVAFAGGILLCAGIIVYALLTA